MVNGLVMWDGTAWQKRIQMLLSLRYQPGAYQPVPDRHKGDCGIEGFSSDGNAYQCFAAQEPLSTVALYQKQRGKITTDINKFINNKQRLTNVLGSVAVEFWILLVPRFESAKLLEHATAKSLQVRAAGLPYAHPQFTVRVATEELFAKEAAALACAGALKLNLPHEEPEATFLGKWSQEHVGLINNMETKIKKLPTVATPEKQLALRDFLIKRYLSGQNVLELMRERYSELYALVAEAKRRREIFLAGETLVTAAPADQTLARQRELFLTELHDSVGNVVHDQAEALTWEAIADWLMRCPLDF
ncbi:hypothetical protein [Anaeromyxobacter paludicola]|uniref:Uncharacterized protein n=1 Tax=Anaeromyxobacter paludicola TaxID=2918171 RepID=A0ABN6NE81_9BACT|nr:hypothetical protein [Anaeromyxobacter paludicola]BDG10795.1 hypothetical protein AMPC_39080 [Anaeromyxobacter paludicola]